MKPTLGLDGQGTGRGSRKALPCAKVNFVETTNLRNRKQMDRMILDSAQHDVQIIPAWEAHGSSKGGLAFDIEPRAGYCKYRS